MTKPRRTLRTRIALGLLIYSLLLTGALLLSGYLINERIEVVVWRALLNAEINRFVEHRAQDPAYPLPRSGTLNAYSRPLAGPDRTVPPALRALPPGLHADMGLTARGMAVLIRDVGAERIYMTIESAEIERNERSLFGWVALSALIGVILLVLVIRWLSDRLLRPVSEFAASVDRLGPDIREHRVEVANDAGLEVATIAAAMNRYLERIDGFVERERTFINSVSHELRTPIAVIGGAADVMEARDDLSEPARKTLRRIRRTVADVDQLIATLLVLAKEPGKLGESEEYCRLEELLPPLVVDHEYLTQDKALRIELGVIEATSLQATGRVIQVAIANLLRNAIEHSDRGTVELWVQPAGVVRIRDPGHGMSSEEIGRFYTATARRSAERLGPGIGLELIRRICEHLGWTLKLESADGQGTLAVLDMRVSLRSGD